MTKPSSLCTENSLLTIYPNDCYAKVTSSVYELSSASPSLSSSAAPLVVFDPESTFASTSAFTSASAFVSASGFNSASVELGVTSGFSPPASPLLVLFSSAVLTSAESPSVISEPEFASGAALGALVLLAKQESIECGSLAQLPWIYPL